MRTLAVCLVLSCASVVGAAASPARDPDLPKGARLRLGTRSRLAEPSASDPLVLSADRQRLATSPGDCVEVRATDTDRLLHRLEGGGATVSPLAFSHDGKTLAVISFTDRRASLLLWPLGGRPKRLRVPADFAANHRPPVAAFLSGDKRLATYDGERLTVWDVATNERLSDDRLRASYGNASFSPDGRLFAAQVGASLVLTDVAGGRWRRIAVPHDEFDWSWSPDGRLIALCVNGGAALHDTQTGRIVRRLSEPVLEMASSAFSPDGRSLVVQGETGLLLFDVASGKLSRKLGINGVRFSFRDDARLLVLVARRLLTWDVRKDVGILRGEEQLGLVTSLAFTADGRTVVSASEDDRLIRWDVRTGRKLSETKAPAGGTWAVFTQRTLSLSADGEAAVVTKEGKGVGNVANVAFLDLRGRRATWDEDDWPLPRGVLGGGLGGFSYAASVASGVISPDGRLAALPLTVGPNQEGGHLVEVRRSNGQALWTFEGSLFVEQAFSPDSRELALALGEGKDARVRLLDLLTGKPRLTLKVAAPGGVHCLNYSPDGRLVVAAADGHLHQWERASGKLVEKTALPAEFGVRQLVVTRSGVLCMGSSRDPNGDNVPAISVWDARSRKTLLATPSGPNHRPAALCGQGRTLAVADDTSVLLFDVPRPPAPKRVALDEGERKRLWNDLASRNTGRAWRALRRLASAPVDAVALLSDRLKPATVGDVKEVADLDTDFGTRQVAATKLAESLSRGDRAAEMALRDLIASPASLEPMLRGRRLLAEAKPVPFTVDELRLIRAVGVLEQIDDERAKALLMRLAKGGPSLLTAEARAALTRLAYIDREGEQTGPARGK